MSLDRALVEADRRTLRIGWFGVEVEYVLHAGDILAVHLRDAPHVLAPRLEVVLGQAPAHGLAGEAVVLGEPDEFIRQQLQGPAGAALRRVRTGGGDEQNLRPLELARRLLATAQKRPEFGALGMAELHPVAYIHPRLLGSRHGQTAESDGRRESACKNFHAQVGPISGVHLRLYAAASPATDRSRHAALLPRQPTFGAPDDPDAGTRRLHPPSAPRRPQHRNARRPGKSPGPTLTSPTGQNLCAAVLVASVIDSVAFF